MVYLTYEKYVEMGGALDRAAFNRAIDRACGVIDSETHDRVKNMPEIPRAVMACCRDLCEYFSEHSGTNKKISSRSESAGSVSESVSYAATNTEEQQREVENIVLDYLLPVKDHNGTPLLYRGGTK